MLFSLRAAQQFRSQHHKAMNKNKKINIRDEFLQKILVQNIYSLGIGTQYEKKTGKTAYYIMQVGNKTNFVLFR
jgi:hypothetical protein